jgi:hypothetical protein
MIEMFKILNKIDKVNWHHSPQFLGNASTRGNDKKIRRQLIKNENVRHTFFTNRITEKWNTLPQVVDADTVNEFKNKLDKFVMAVKV